jgi:hypothetical protein
LLFERRCGTVKEILREWGTGAGAGAGKFRRKRGAVAHCWV